MDQRNAETTSPHPDPGAERERALRRARRLRSLASSPNAHEAETAARLLSSHMLDHELCEADLAEREDDGTVDVELACADGFGAEWSWRLASLAAELAGCTAVRVREAGRSRVRLLGERNDAREAEVLFSVLCSAVRVEGGRAALAIFAHYPGLSRQSAGRVVRSFLLGVVDSLTSRLVLGAARAGARRPGPRAPAPGPDPAGAGPSDPGAGTLARAARGGGRAGERAAAYRRRGAEVGWDPSGAAPADWRAYRAGCRRGAAVPLPRIYL